MRKFLAVLLAILMMMSVLTACSRDDYSSDDEPRPDKNNNTSGDVNENILSTQGKIKVETISVDDSGYWNYCYTFINGVAYGNINGNAYYSCYDKDGNIIFDLEEGMEPLCLAKDGYSLASFGAEFYIVDPHGNVTNISEYGEGALPAYEIISNGTIAYDVRFAAADGYFILARELVSYDGTVCEAAVVKEGELVIDFSADFYKVVGHYSCIYFDSYVYLDSGTEEGYPTVNLNTGEYGYELNQADIDINAAPKLDIKTFYSSEEYVGDYAVVQFESGNSEAVYYFSVVDRNEEMLFDPVQYTTASGYGTTVISGDTIFIWNISKISNGFQIVVQTYDMTGVKKAEREYILGDDILSVGAYCGDGVFTVRTYKDRKYTVTHYDKELQELFT